MDDAGWRIRSSELTWREVNGVVIALDLASSSYFSTNASGSVMWKALIEGASSKDLCTLLQSRYRISPTQAKHDVKAFIDLLSDHQLLGPYEPNDPAPGDDQ